MKLFDKITNFAFCIFIFTFFIAHIAIPDKTFSDDENRLLKTFPEITLKDILSGNASGDIQVYIQDQFPLRSEFVAGKTSIDVAMGKTLINGTYICGDTLLQQFELFKTSLLEANINKVESLSEKINTPINLLIIPSSIYINEEILPENHLDSNQDDLFKLITSRLSKTNFIDIRNVLKESTNNPFYRTDHHLTLEGTSIVYNSYLNATGQEFRDYYFDVVSDNFKGSLSSKSGAFWIDGDDVLKYNSPITDVSVKITEGSKTKVYNSVYFEERLEEKNKYPYYLDGNHALVEINTNQPEKPNLLVIADSFGQSLAPFLLEDYNKITYIDLRYYKQPVSEIADEFDEILIYYSLVNFSTDTNITFLR